MQNVTVVKQKIFFALNYTWQSFENVLRVRTPFEHLASPPSRCREFAARKWRIVSQIRFESGKGC